jgi:hypothetical protein
LYFLISSLLISKIYKIIDFGGITSCFMPSEFKFFPILTTRNLNAGVAITDYGRERGGGGPEGFRLRLAKLLGGYFHEINLFYPQNKKRIACIPQ